MYSNNTSRDEIVLDCDVSYSGDARVVFTLQVFEGDMKIENDGTHCVNICIPFIDSKPISSNTSHTL